jgi:hypothetical protein
MGNNWGLSVGQAIEWETTGHGNIQRQGVIIALIPAGVSVESISLIDPAKISRGVLPKSSVDRYAVEVSRLNSSGTPVKSGAKEIKLPNRWSLEKSLGVNS